MTLRQRILLTLLAFAFPACAFAAAPAVVTGIHADYANGVVTVRWDPVPDADVAKYRVYYSTQSILDHNGEYNDTVTTADATTSAVITTLPQTDTLYVSVLAVNSANEESAFFGEEASVKIGTATAPSVESSSSLSSAAASSSPSSQNVSSVAAASAASSISSASTEQPATTAVGAISTQVTPEGNGLFDVDVAWNPGENAAQFAYYNVFQSVDGGRTYGLPARVTTENQHITITGVPLVDFGIAVQGVRLDGTSTPIIFQGVALSAGRTGGGVSGPIASARSSSSRKTIPALTTGGNKLPSSGIELSLVLAASGAVLGWRRTRKSAARR